MPLVLAHRGASGTVPENTELAIQTAIVAGADLIELDVQLTSDGEVVLFHDRDLQRVAGRLHRIADLNLTTIQQIDVGSWFGPEFSQLRIPTLQKVLQRTSGQSLIVEIKPYDHKNWELETKVLDLLDDYSGLGEGYISVRDTGSYDWFKQHCNYRIGFMQKHLSPAELFDIVQTHEISIIQIRAEEFGTKYDQLGSYQGESYVYGANTPAEWDYLGNQPIDGILTNYPAVMRAHYQLQSDKI